MSEGYIGNSAKCSQLVRYVFSIIRLNCKVIYITLLVNKYYLFSEVIDNNNSYE